MLSGERSCACASSRTPGEPGGRMAIIAVSLVPGVLGSGRRLRHAFLNRLILGSEAVGCRSSWSPLLLAVNHVNYYPYYGRAESDGIDRACTKVSSRNFSRSHGKEAASGFQTFVQTQQSWSSRGTQHCPVIRCAPLDRGSWCGWEPETE